MNTSDLSLVARLDQHVVGYVVNASFSAQTSEQIYRLQSQIMQSISDGVWFAPKHALHITLLDLLTPITEYGIDKDELFLARRAEWEALLGGIIGQTSPVDIHFDTIEVFPSAIIIRGHDNGTFAEIRRQFMDEAHLDILTKRPPSIIHSTIAKFTKQLPLKPLQTLSRTMTIDFDETISEFNLSRETIVFMQESDIVRTYPLLPVQHSNNLV